MTSEFQANPTIAELMKAAAADAVSSTEVFFAGTLDGTPESIRVIEAKADAPSETERDLFERAWGAYIGEMFRQHVGGEWGVYKSADGVRVKAFHCNGQTIFPEDKVHKRLTAGAQHNLVDYFDTWRTLMLGKSG